MIHRHISTFIIKSQLIISHFIIILVITNYIISNLYSSMPSVYLFYTKYYIKTNYTIYNIHYYIFKEMPSVQTYKNIYFIYKACTCKVSYYLPPTDLVCNKREPMDDIYHLIE